MKIVDYDITKMLIQASKHDHLEVAKFLIEREKSLNRASAGNEYDALMIATNGAYKTYIHTRRSGYNIFHPRMETPEKTLSDFLKYNKDKFKKWKNIALDYCDITDQQRLQTILGTYL